MRIVIVGAGGHAQVVADALLKGDHHVVGYVDDDHSMHGSAPLGVEVLGAVGALASITHDAAVIAVGDNETRARLTAMLLARGEQLVSAIHPSAHVGLDVAIGHGSMLCAGAIVITGSRLGSGVIVNTGATIDHHNVIGDFVHVAPGVHTGGEVHIGTATLVGIGATVLPRVRIGAHAVVGAGAVVTKDVPDGACVGGVPARKMRVKA